MFESSPDGSPRSGMLHILASDDVRKKGRRATSKRIRQKPIQCVCMCGVAGRAVIVWKGKEETGRGGMEIHRAIVTDDVDE